MADNVTLPGTGALIGTETVSTAQVQQVKVLWGALDTGTEIAAATPLPVVQTGIPALPAGAALDATGSALNTNFGAQADVAATADTGPFSFIAYFKRSVAKLTAIVTVLAGGLPAALGAGGGVKIDGSGTVLPVSISSTAAPTLGTIGGWLPFHSAVIVNTPLSIKASTAGQVGGIELFNTSAAARSVKIWDKASIPTVGTDVPKKTYVLQPTSGLVIPNPTVGGQYALGIWVAVTNLPADTDNTAPAIGDVIINISYN